MQNEKNIKTLDERMLKTARIISVLLKIARIILWVGLAVMMLATIFVITVPELIDFSNVNIALDGVLSGITLDGNGDPAKLLILCFCAAIPAIACFLVGLYIVGRIFKDVVNQHTPFTEGNPRRIKSLALVYIAMHIVPKFFLAIGSFFVRTGFDININLSLLSTALGALILWSIGQMFEYGARLQQQEDETI